MDDRDRTWPLSHHLTHAEADAIDLLDLRWPEPDDFMPGEGPWVDDGGPLDAHSSTYYE